MTMATKRARDCVRVSQAARRLERMVNDYHPTWVHHRRVIEEYGLYAHKRAVQLHMWNTADRVLQLLDRVRRAE